VAAKWSLREREIAARHAKGETHSIAVALSLSPATLRNHLAHCFKKLGVSNKVELASRLERKG
jgi:DNA-binding NarL/FixJ family response regulator